MKPTASTSAAVTLTLLMGLCAPALALTNEPDKKPETPTPPTTPAPASDKPAEPAKDTNPMNPAAAPAAAPKGIPVPNLPIVNKQELEGGLIIEDMKIGEGYEVKPSGTVVALYHGTVKDSGVVFDSAFERSEPISFPLDGVITGWKKGVPGMKVGGIRKLTIPAAMAYGDNPPPGAGIPPKADLVFVIQLVDALQINDSKEGTGEAAGLNCLPVTTYTIKDAEGKVLESRDAANPYIWLPGEFAAMQYGVVGMKVGGKRTLTVPKELNMTNPGLPTTRPSNVPVTIEIELIGLRNLPTR